MATDRGDAPLIIAQLVVLLSIVAVVDQPLVRTGLAFAVGLLLVQRALGLTAPQRDSQGADRRADEATRDAVLRLLARIREFYAACHLLRMEQISPAEARDRTSKIEKDLDQLLGEVMATSRGEAPPVETVP